MIPFDIDMHQAQTRNFPFDAPPQFMYLAEMPSQHKTFWTETHKVKRFSLEYGQQLVEQQTLMKNAGNQYMNEHWLEHYADGQYMWLLFSMVDCPVMLDMVIQNPTPQLFTKYALEMIEQLECNMFVPVGDKFLCAHDYKMYNVVYDGQEVLCFDYDRFSIQDNPNILYDELLEKFVNDDLKTTELTFTDQECDDILELCRRKINEFKCKTNL